MVHCCDLWLSGYAFWLAKKLNVPSILHVHKPVTPRDVRKFKCGNANRVVAISTKIRDNLISAGISSEKVVRIDDSVDVELFTPQQFSTNVLREEFSPAGDILIGIVGRIDEFKRQLDFLMAAKEALCRSRRSVTFFVIGEVHSRDYFEKIQKFIRDNSTEKDVLFTGRRNDMPAIMSSIDILVSNSGGSVMFEAMAAGKAVISAGFTLRKYSYHIQDGKTGLLIESKEPADLARAMNNLIDNSELRQKLGLEAREWALKELTHTKMSAKTQQLYDELLTSDFARDNDLSLSAKRSKGMPILNPGKLPAKKC
jgi:glycosyltransferase involved in cell wall biosynthesis